MICACTCTTICTMHFNCEFHQLPSNPIFSPQKIPCRVISFCQLSADEIHQKVKLWRFSRIWWCFSWESIKGRDKRSTADSYYTENGVWKCRMERGNSSEKKEEALLLLFYTEHTHKHNSCRSRISLTKRAPGSTTTVRRSEMLILSELTFSLS